jgi:hypothetical protein
MTTNSGEATVPAPPLECSEIEPFTSAESWQYSLWLETLPKMLQRGKAYLLTQ